MSDIIEPYSAELTGLYRFLAQTMRYPDKSWMGMEFWESFFHVAGKVPAMPQMLLRRAMAEEESGRVEALQTEYIRLFVNGFPDIAAPPYGSFYLGTGSARRRLSADEILLFYESKGFRLADNGEPPDWLVHQLDFMAILASDDQEGLDDFIETIFRPWFVKFREKVSSDSRHPYYVIAVKLIDFFTA